MKCHFPSYKMFSQWLNKDRQTDKQLEEVVVVEVLPVQVVGGLVQECVILSDKLSPDQLGTWLLHHHFFGQLEISVRKKRKRRVR